MIPVRGYKGHRVGVLGLGRSGLATARSLVSGGAIALCWDDDEQARAGAAAAGLLIHDFSAAQAWDDVVALVVSPGIPHLYPAPHAVVRAAWDHGVAVDNDIGLFFRSFATQEWDNFEVLPRVVAITGSNGKSTTAALVHHILQDNARPCQLGGNIGRGVLDLDPAVDREVVVLELSSYQIELARALAPDIGVFLNLSADHLDRHGGIGGYFAAKRRLFAAGAPERAIIGVDESEGQFLANQTREVAGTGAPVIRISASRKLAGKDWNIFARKGFLAEWRNGRQVGSIDLRGILGLPGVHNHQNACAAYAVCRCLGLAPKAVEKSLATYPGLPHRAQVLQVKDGVTYVNDSKATNAQSAAMSLRAFDNIRWIAGGQGKEGGIAGLGDCLGRVRKAYLIGESAKDFAAQLGDTDHEVCGTMATAVAQAAKDAQQGDTVLLAPAAASFDQYSSFEARGDDFGALVAAL